MDPRSPGALLGALVIEPVGNILLACIERVPGCAAGRFSCVLRERAAPHRMVHPSAHGEGATREEAIRAARAALSLSLTIPPPPANHQEISQESDR